MTTGHEILQDIKDFFLHLSTIEYDIAGGNFSVDMSNIVVVGASAGGLCALLAGLHVSPKPRAVLDLYGMGENFWYFSSPFLLPLVVTDIGSDPILVDPQTKPFCHSDPLIIFSERPFLQTVLYLIDRSSQEAIIPSFLSHRTR